MHCRPFFSLNLFGLLLVLITDSGQAANVDFSRDIQPILAKRCFACHGPAEQQSGLAFHERSLATSKAESGQAAILPGNPGESGLIQRVTSTDESLRMPP